MTKRATYAAALFALAFIATALAPCSPATAQQIASTSTPARERVATAAHMLKRIVLSTGESAEGSRVHITSDAPLDGYETFKEGGKFYVLIRDTEAAALAGRALAGRGFKNVEAEQRGDDALIAFTTEPGFEPRVRASFNRLEIVFASQDQKQTSGNSSSSGSS